MSECLLQVSGEGLVERQANFLVIPAEIRKVGPKLLVVGCEVGCEVEEIVVLPQAADLGLPMPFV